MAYLCYHHNDMDGKAAGNEVYKYFESQRISATSNMFIQRGYDESFITRDYEGKTVFIVDLSFTKESIKKLFDICELATKVIWIDHHKSSMECLEDIDISKKLKNYTNLRYIVNNNASGALLTNLYFQKAFKDYDSHLTPDFEISFDNAGRCCVTDPDAGFARYDVPIALKHIDEWDRWVYGDNRIPVNFNFGSNCHNTALFAYPIGGGSNKIYNAGFWRSLNNSSFVNKLIEEGETVQLYINSKAARDTASIGYECDIDGHKAFVLNSNGNSMMAGDKINKYDLICLWSYNGKLNKYQYSLYSGNESVDCAAIASKINPEGGGHRGAAGFSMNTLIFKPKKTN